MDDVSRKVIPAYHLRQPPCSRDVACMDQAVQVSRGFLDLLSHIIVAVQVKDVSDEIKSVLIILHIRIEPSQIEAVREVVFVDFAEVFVTTRRDELHADLSASIRLRWCLTNRIKA